MTMQIGYASAFNELEISGTRGDFKDMATLLQRHAGKLCVEKNYNPLPYDCIIEEISVECISETGVVFLPRPSSRNLLVTGSIDKLDLLAINIEAFGSEGPVNSDWHCEFFDEHPYLGEKSVPLVCFLLG